MAILFILASCLVMWWGSSLLTASHLTRYLEENYKVANRQLLASLAAYVVGATLLYIGIRNGSS